MADPLIYVRAVHFAATLVAAGAVLFLVLIAEPAFGGAGDATRIAALVRARLRFIVWLGLVVAVISGVAWLFLTAAAMSGRPLAQVFAQGVLWTVLAQTNFGRDWLVRLVLAGLLAAAFAPSLSAPRIKSVGFKTALVILAAALAGTLAWAGHAAGGVGREAIVHPSADVLHLVAAAAWVGALVPLALLLNACAQDNSALAIARNATLRFSTLGIASVGTLLVTGVINSWYLAGSIAALFGSDYGRLLLAKIALFLGMVAIAAVNRLRLTPRIVRDAQPAAALRHLRRNAVIEACAGALVIMIVGVLGTLPPANHAQHHAAYGPVPAGAAFVHIHSEQGMADVTIEPGRAGTAHAIIRLWNDDFGTLASREVTLTLTAPGPGPGSKPTTHLARPAPDESWQVDDLALSQPGNWTVVVSAVLGPAKRLVLDAPIVIEPP